MPNDPFRDTVFRSLFSHPRMVRDFVRGFLAEEWASWLDLDTLEACQAGKEEPPPDGLDEVLVRRLRWQGGSAWVYLLLKLQWEEDPAQALHMSFHRELLYQDLLRRKPSAPLPVALPVVVYGGRSPWRAPREALELFLPLLPSLQRHVPRTRYVLLDLLHGQIPAAAGEDNLVALLCRLERSRTPAGVDALLERLIAAVSGTGDESLRQAWSSYLGRWFLPGRFPDLFTAETMAAWDAEAVLA